MWAIGPKSRVDELFNLIPNTYNPDPTFEIQWGAWGLKLKSY
jgi:hypothetical protein